MSNGYRSNIGYAGEPIQQSMTSDPGDRMGRNEVRMKLGVVLAVYTADSIYNKSAQQTPDFRGCRHECSVQIIEDGTNNYSRLDNVIITPNVASGIDNYEETLPRGSSQSVNITSTFDPSLMMMDPYDLDGDWCVVGFLGGENAYPFIVRWWPNPRNFFDPQTTGPSSANVNSQGFVLDQSNRYFRRINGVEMTITKIGDLYLDMSTAGGTPVFGVPPQKGRLVRPPLPTGGNIRSVFKTTSSLELDWNMPQDGEGFGSTPDPQLVQTNPATTPNGNTFTPTQKVSTFVQADASNFMIQVPVEFNVTSKSLIELDATNTINILAPSITVGGRNTDLQVDTETTTMVSHGNTEVYADSIIIGSDKDTTLTAQNVYVTATNTEVVVAGPRVVVNSDVIELGGNLGSSQFLIDQRAGVDAFEKLALLVPPLNPPTPVGNAASITSIINYLQLLASNLNSNVTQKTKAE